MGLRFREFRERLDLLRNALDDFSKFHDTMCDPDFDPMLVNVRGFDAYENPGRLASFVLEAVPESKAVCQLALIEHNIRQMQTTMMLIEAQNELLSRRSGSGVVTTLESDKASFPDLLQQTFAISTANKQANVSPLLDQKSLMDHVSVLNRDYGHVVKGKPVRDLSTLDTPALLQRIYELRFDFVDDSLNKTEFSLENVDMDLNVALVLRKLADEGISGNPDFAKDMADKFMGSAKRIIKSVGLALRETDLFVGQVFDMDPDNDGVRSFEAKTYIPVSIRPLTEFIA